MRLLALAAGLVVAALMAPAPVVASADGRASVDDPQDDVVSTLDLQRVQLAAKGPRIVARFTTYDVLARRDLDGANGLHLRFGLGKQQRYREVLVQSLGGEWVGTICSGRVGHVTVDRDCTRLRTQRTGDRALRVAVPRRLVDPGARTYRWNAWSEVAIRTAGCDGSGPCDDYLAPEGTYLRWRAPKA